MSVWGEGLSHMDWSAGSIGESLYNIDVVVGVYDIYTTMSTNFDIKVSWEKT